MSAISPTGIAMLLAMGTAILAGNDFEEKKHLKPIET